LVTEFKKRKSENESGLVIKNGAMLNNYIVVVGAMHRGEMVMNSFN